MFLDYGLEVVCAAITNFYVVFVENLAVPVIFRKVFADEVPPMFVCTFILYGGLNKITFLCSFLRLFCAVWAAGFLRSV